MTNNVKKISGYEINYNPLAIRVWAPVLIVCLCRDD